MAGTVHWPPPTGRAPDTKHHGERIMKTVTTLVVASLMASLGMASVVEAKTLLSKKERCFKIGDAEPGGWNQTLKIKPQQALSDKKGAIVETVALEHGSKVVGQPLNYYNQFAGAASYLPPGDQEISNMVQIALVGTSVGTDTGTMVGKREMFSFNYSVTLEPEVKGVIRSAHLFGVETVTPLEGGSPTQTVVNEQLEEIACKDF
jgi:hypothetical protein